MPTLKSSRDCVELIGTFCTMLEPRPDKLPPFHHRLSLWELQTLRQTEALCQRLGTDGHGWTDLADQVPISALQSSHNLGSLSRVPSAKFSTVAACPDGSRNCLALARDSRRVRGPLPGVAARTIRFRRRQMSLYTVSYISHDLRCPELRSVMLWRVFRDIYCARYVDVDAFHPRSIRSRNGFMTRAMVQR